MGSYFTEISQRNKWNRALCWLLWHRLKYQYKDRVSEEFFTLLVVKLTEKLMNIMPCFYPEIKLVGGHSPDCLSTPNKYFCTHYGDVIMGAMASQITGLTIVYSTVYSGTNQRKHQSSALLAFVRGLHRWPVNSPHKWPVTRKMFPFDDVIMRRCTKYICDCKNQFTRTTDK